MTTKEEMPPSQADVGCAIEMLAHISEPIAAALSALLAHVRAEARAEGVAEMKEALVCLLDETSPDDFSSACLLCGTRGELDCCPEVAAARAALEKKP